MALYNQSVSNISTQTGAPLFGIAGLPPFTGNFYWVDGTFGSDGNTGGPQDPLKTVAQALARCVAGSNDVVLISGTFTLSATLAWSKNRTHLIGLGPTSGAQLSATTGTVFTPMVNVTATDCIFQNIHAVHGFNNASAQICWSDTGGRNQYTNCSFTGMADATAGAQAGGRSVYLGGTVGNNTFTNCRIGGDTVARSAANGSLQIDGGSPRNSFIDCVFPVQTSAATASCVLTAGATPVGKYAYFRDCLFVNAVNSGSTTMNAAFNMAATAGGLMALQRCTAVGMTKWGVAAALTQMYVDGGAPTAASTGLGVNPT